MAGREVASKVELSNSPRSSRPLFLFALLAALIATACLAVLVGSMGPIGPGRPEWISVEEALRAIFLKEGDAAHVTIFWNVRIPRIILAGLVGAGLACAGTAMQAVFRNPMADPFIVGVSSGAALGAASVGLLLAALALKAATPIMAPMMAFASSIVTVFAVYKLGTVKGRVYVDTLLLSGVAVSAFLGSVVSFLVYFAREDYHQLIPWLLGSLATSTWTQVMVVFSPIIAGSAVVFLYGRDLNALLLGEETAHNLGADPESLKKLMLGIAALMTAGAVAFCGIIGFVGLIVPHMMRIFVGANHRVLVPAATLFGASFLIWADTIARSILAGQELPVGVITAMCGGPFFIYLLRRSRTGGGML